MVLGPGERDFMPMKAKIFAPGGFFCAHEGLRYLPTRGFGDVCLEGRDWFVALGTFVRDLVPMRAKMFAPRGVFVPTRGRGICPQGVLEMFAH